MSTSATMRRSADASTIPAFRPADNVPGHPSFSLSDLWKAPLHDLPIRDEILYQCLTFSREMRVLEIGPGNGFTAFRMSREIGEATLVDLSTKSIEKLREKLKGIENLSFVSADICGPHLMDRVGSDFDIAFGLSVFQYVQEPAACLRNLAKILRPGGILLLEFPNYAPPNRGVNWIADRHELDDMLNSAGFDSWQIFALRLRPKAAFFFKYFHEKPFALLRALRESKEEHEPARYERTWAFEKARALNSWKFCIHAFWAFVMAILNTKGGCFNLQPVGEDVLNHDILLLARKREHICVFPEGVGG
jgi:SAM-dependent methyltransferase